MKEQLVDDYYTSRKPHLLKDFDNMIKRVRKVLASYFGDDLADIIIEEARQEFEALIPELPYIGGKKNPLEENPVGSAYCLALYRVLKNHGKTVEEAGKIVYETGEEYLRSSSIFSKLKLRVLSRLMFTKLGKYLIKRWAAESQKRRYPGDWVYTYVEGDGKEFDFGIDYTECGICKFFHAQGADEFMPFMCLLDFPHSKASSSGLVRTMTLAEGAEKCDFRFKRSREVKQGWPPEFLHTRHREVKNENEHHYMLRRKR